MAAQELQSPPFTQGGGDSFAGVPTDGEAGGTYSAPSRGFTYHPVPLEDPPQYQPPQPLGYSPAPTSFPQQATNTSAVVAQPTGSQPQETVGDLTTPRVKEHMIFTVFLGAFCVLLNPTSLFFVIPAIIFDCLAIQQNNFGDYKNAKTFGTASFFCDVLMVIYNFMVVTAVCVALFVKFVYT